MVRSRIRSRRIARFFEAGRGLVTSLAKLGMIAKAVDLVQDLVQLDPSDPLKLRQLVDEARTGG